ncbi:hypothetical protein [Streptomyces sp. NPDC057580]|uniref:hypothetical protein n=1 Tax=Streptomyces sp. NPDC057580 TaxID=3346173 RepID=UPI00368F932A
MQTITERFGRRRLTIFFVCCFLVLGAVGVVKSVTSDDGPPSCAKQYVNASGLSATGRNAALDCDAAIEKWCAKNHPEDPGGCSNAVELDGDARNVGKD